MRQCARVFCLAGRTTNSLIKVLETVWFTYVVLDNTRRARARTAISMATDQRIGATAVPSTRTSCFI